MSSIFISYRREDAEGQAGRLFDDLVTKFGKDSVFMDVVDIEPGRDFRRVIDRHVASCSVLLAVVGKGWIDAVDQAGRRRLDNPDDFVRLETASALRRDIPVVPVLVQGAKMPAAERLPEDLKEFAFRNAVELTHARWDSDVQLLIKALSSYVDVGGLQDVAAKSGDRSHGAPAIAGRMGVRGEEAGARSSGTPVAPRPRTVSWRGAVVVSVAVLAVLFGAYKVHENSQKTAEGRRAGAARAAPDGATAENAAAEPAADPAGQSGAPTDMTLDAIIENMGAVSGAKSGSLTRGLERTFSPPEMGFAKGWETRGFLSFDVSRIPRNMRVVAAQLYCKQVGGRGDLSRQGITVVMEAIDIRGELHGADFDRAGTIVAQPSLDRFCSEPYDVTSSVARARAASRGVVTFRFRFDPLPTTEGAWRFDYRPGHGTRLAAKVGG